MGTYLVVNKKENNTKSISYPMIGLMRFALPDKVTLNDDRFVLTVDEVAAILYTASKLVEDDDLLNNYIEDNSEQYEFKDDFEDIKNRFLWIENCFALTLSEMIIKDKSCIVCYKE